MQTGWALIGASAAYRPARLLNAQVNLICDRRAGNICWRTTRATVSNVELGNRHALSLEPRFDWIDGDKSDLAECEKLPSATSGSKPRRSMR